MNLFNNICLATFILIHILINLANSSEEGNVDEHALMLKLNRIVRKSGHNWSMGVVPYYLDSDSYDEIIARRVRAAMTMIEQASCVVFKELAGKPSADYQDWVHITNPSKERECVHEPSTGPGGEIVMVLGFDCIQNQEVLHSLLHVLGLKDEVTHPHRDQYIRIMWENIQPKYRPLFRINMDETPYKTLVEYDTMSVMHFHDRAFSMNGGATIAALIPGLMITPSDRLSQLDLMKLRLAFGHECNRRNVGNLLDTCRDAMRADQESESESADTPEAASVETEALGVNDTAAEGAEKTDADASSNTPASNSDYDEYGRSTNT